MTPSPRQARRDPARRAEVSEWLREAAACLLDFSRALPAPPGPELQATYEAVHYTRQQIEQSRHDLIESIQMQSLQTVGSILAHDLHNLALRLSLLSQNLQQFYGDREFLQSAKEVLDDTVERMQSLVDGFRERQEVVIVKISTDVNEVLRAVVRQTGVGEVSGIELREELQPTPPIWADSFFLANAFRVLLENSVEAMPEGGRLTIRSGAAADFSVHVEIEDTGVGMTRSFVERELFAPFRSSKGRGLGLGMYICQHIIRLHDGAIRVDSEPGYGSRFRLSFPPGPEQA